MVTAVHKGLLDSLREDLGYRRIGDGMARLDAYWEQMGRRVDPRDPDAASLLCYLAQWVDAGWREIDAIEEGLAAIPKERRGDLSLRDYVHVLMAEGVFWVHEELVERALVNFRLVLSLAEDVPD